MSPSKLGEIHYIPHHPVIRDDKTTRKIRIVFDASARNNGPSLNDCLQKGPHLTPLLYDILLRFSSHVVALTSDIEKVFLQINVNENDLDYLRFLWFDNIFSDQSKIVPNRFARVVFGVTSSPFYLNGTIRKHIQSYDFDKDFIYMRCFHRFLLMILLEVRKMQQRHLNCLKNSVLDFQKDIFYYENGNKQFRITESNQSF